MRILTPVLGTELSALVADESGMWTARLFGDRRRIGSLVCFPGGIPHPVAMSEWPPWGRDFAATFQFRPSALPLRRGWRTVFTLLDRDAGAMLERPSRAVAIALALLVGWSGAHWFYLGDRRRGVRYLLMLVIVPMFLAYYDALRFVLADRAEFESTWVAAPPAA